MPARRQRPGLVFAKYLRGDAFTPEQKQRNFDYYEKLTVRDSSLSPAVRRYRLLTGEPIELAHHGDSFLLGQRPVTLPVPKIANRTPPAQPKGREPYRRIFME
jgi:alpha,alpha-trehalose phosphorylase